MLVGYRLKQARKNQGLTQEALGKILGLSGSAISLYESEKRNPSLENVIEMMYILGVDANFLLGSDVVVEIKDSKVEKYQTLTKEEMYFINELRQNKMAYEILCIDPKRGMQVIKDRVGK